MKSTEESRALIIDVLAKRGAPKACPLCQTQIGWTISEGFVTLLVHDDPLKIQMASGKGLPCAVLLCDNCGNTHLINLVKLGLQDLLREDS